MGVLITPMASAYPLHPIRSRSRNKRRNLWDGWCVSTWRPWFWSVYSIYYIHTIYYSCTLSNWNKLFLWDMHTKSWCGHDGHDTMVYAVCLSIFLCCVGWYDTAFFFLSGFKCSFQLYNSGFCISWYGYRYHMTLCIGQLHPITVCRTVVWVCAVLVLSVIMCSFYYFLDRILFHHEIHHDSCE